MKVKVVVLCAGRHVHVGPPGVVVLLVTVLVVVTVTPAEMSVVRAVRVTVDNWEDSESAQGREKKGMLTAALTQVAL